MLWIFAYGSLIFRPGFSFERREVASVGGFERRFYQGSTDHRGVPGAPGRVATLVPSQGARTWGVALGLSEERAAPILDGLDFRERGGYTRLGVPLTLRSGDTLGEGLVYLATPENPEWLGPDEPSRMAAQIASARGPSGPNREYLLELARALAELEVDDPHVFDLADRVEPNWRPRLRSEPVRQRLQPPRALLRAVG